MYLALHHPFHLACCMLTAGPGPGLTNHSQISASHVPRGASLELIPASAGHQWWVSVLYCTTYTCMGMQVWIICRRDRASHRLSNAARVTENTSTSFVSLENNKSAGCRNNFVMQHNHWCWKIYAYSFREALKQRQTTHLDSLQSLWAFRSCWTVKRTLLSREGNISIMKGEVVSEQIWKKGHVIRSYLEVCTAFLSANKLPWRTLDGQRDG